MKLPKLKILMVLALASNNVLAAPELSFEPIASPIMVGDSFNLMLVGSGFDLTSTGTVINNITGGQKVNIAFSADQVELMGVTIDSIWTFASSNKTGTIDNANGTLTGFGFGAFPAILADDFPIAMFNFKAVKTGPATISLDSAEIIGKVNNIAGTKIATGLGSTSVQVASVPLPGAAWLFGSIIFGAAIFRKKNKI